MTVSMVEKKTVAVIIIDLHNYKEYYAKNNSAEIYICCDLRNSCFSCLFPKNRRNEDNVLTIITLQENIIGKNVQERRITVLVQNTKHPF